MSEKQTNKQNQASTPSFNDVIVTVTYLQSVVEKNEAQIRHLIFPKMQTFIAKVKV